MVLFGAWQRGQDARKYLGICPHKQKSAALAGATLLLLCPIKRNPFKENQLAMCGRMAADGAKQDTAITKSEMAAKQVTAATTHYGKLAGAQVGQAHQEANEPACSGTRAAAPRFLPPRQPNPNDWFKAKSCSRIGNSSLQVAEN